MDVAAPLFMILLTGCSRETVLASYSTSLAGRTPEQIINIRLASRALNGYLLPPGGIFSFNRVVGPYTWAKGYRSAPAIILGHNEKVLAGGICQVSSTLYGVALRANLKIIERVPHIFPVSSVPPGFDATVSYRKNYAADLKFKNPYPFPLRFTSTSRDSRLTISARGKKLPFRVTLFAQRTGKDASRVLVYREVLSEGKGISRELISADTYRKEH